MDYRVRLSDASGSSFTFAPRWKRGFYVKCRAYVTGNEYEQFFRSGLSLLARILSGPNRLAL